MGVEFSSSKYSKLEGVQTRVEESSGKIMVSGRYKRLPKRIEDDYSFPKKDRVVLGTGYNGAVFQATSIADPTQSFAVKQFHLHGVTKKQKKMLETEVEVFLSMDHPHVCRLVDVYECDKLLNLVMECMHGGELFSRVVARKYFSEVDAAHATWQMLLAVAYLHGKGIVHRDLKLENFLYETKEGDHLKLIDFGFSHIWDPDTTMQSSCGTLSYLAPEVLKGKYTSKCDLWSLGVIVFILLVGYMPFHGSELNQIDSIKKGKYLWKASKWARVSIDGQNFVKSLLTLDQQARPTAEQALEHRFIQCHDAVQRRSQKEIPDGEEDPGKATADALLAYSQASHFKRAAMSVMAWSLTCEERAQVRDCFIRIDSSKTGKITLGDLKQVFKDHLEIKDEHIQPIFDALDTSANEEINYTEFLAAMVSTRIAMHDELLIKTFARFDVDNTGYISKENLKKVLGDNFDGSSLDDLIASADKGNTGQISYEDFFAYLKNGHSKQDVCEIADHLIDEELSKPEASSLRTPEGWGANYLCCKTKGFIHHIASEAKDPMMALVEVSAIAAPKMATSAQDAAKATKEKTSRCCVIS